MSGEVHEIGSHDVCMLPIEALQPGDSPRLAGEDADHVALLAQAEGPMPPIVVHRATMRVIDGMHRLRAARVRGQRHLEVRFFDGDEEEAFVAAVRANQTHGLPLTLADREAAAVRILRARPYLSDRSVAGITGLAASTVAAVRQRKVPNGAQAVRIGRDGRVRPVNGDRGRRMASAMIEERPDASLREIARVAGISPATARDVRERMRRGEDPMLSSQRARAAERRPASGPAGAGANTAGGRAGALTPADTVYDRVTLMHSLNRDPALRLRESGREFLRWFYARAAGPAGWEELVNTIPPHCGYLVAGVAQCCAEEWLEFAAQVKQRLGATA